VLPSDAPALDEIELSIFGPGVGECQVIHCGNGDWFIVDSCIRSGSRRAIALEYLSGMGVDVSQALKGILISHWDNDHIRGASQILDAAPQAAVWVSQALNCREFSNFLKLSRQPGSGTDEFRSVIRTTLERDGTPRYASSGKKLYTGSLCSITALSPSDGSITTAFQSIGRLIPVEGAPIARFPNPIPNDLCVASVLEFRNTSWLLGADLPIGRTFPLTGWRAVVEEALCGKIDTIKVPHHGSSNAYH
jgi:hypothetical protein